MKRLGNLYSNLYSIKNILSAYNEICQNTQNQRKVIKFQDYKSTYISRIYDVLQSKQYIPGPYNIFTIYEPKKRRIVSQNMFDKVINHLISRQILYPAILPCLLDVNVASRKNLGTHEGLELSQKFHRLCKIQYKKNYYVLKCDISNFFASINHDILKEKLRRRIKDKDALDIVYKVIDSDSTGLSIGNMTSQVLAIFYLNDMDHYIKEQLHIKYYVRYQDDFLLFHPSKKYLKYCLNQLTIFLQKEKLVLNKKTRIFKGTDNFIYLGRNINGKYAKYRLAKRKLKKRKYLYLSKKIPLSSFANSVICYKHLEEFNKKNKKQKKSTSSPPPNQTKK